MTAKQAASCCCHGDDADDDISTSGSSLLLHDAISWHLSLYIYILACFLTQVDETFRDASVFTVSLLPLYARLTVELLFTWAVYFLVLYVPCNNKFGMQHRFGFDVPLMLLRHLTTAPYSWSRRLQQSEPLSHFTFIWVLFHLETFNSTAEVGSTQITYLILHCRKKPLESNWEWPLSILSHRLFSERYVKDTFMSLCDGGTRPVGSANHLPYPSPNKDSSKCWMTLSLESQGQDKEGLVPPPGRTNTRPHWADRVIIAQPKHLINHLLAGCSTACKPLPFHVGWWDMIPKVHTK